MGSSNHTKIIFDANPKELVSIFINAGLAGFKNLEFAKGKTCDLLQQFTNNYVAGKEYISMYFEPDGTIMLTPDEKTELVFGSQTAKEGSSTRVFISAKQDRDNESSESTIQAYTKIQNTLENPQPNYYENLPDFVKIETTTTSNDQIDYDVQRFLVFKDRIEEMPLQPTEDEEVQE